MELLTWAFVLAFILSVGFNLYQTLVLTKLQTRLSQYESELADLNSALGAQKTSRSRWL